MIRPARARRPPQPPTAWDDFGPHPQRDYALLADGYRGALVGPRGDAVWLCAPSWESEVVLGALVGGEGVYAVTPVDPYVAGGEYEPGTLIWHDRWTTTSTVVDCHEALACPGDPHVVRLLRAIVAGDEEVRLRVVLDLRAGFSGHRARAVRRLADGTWTGRLGELRFRWSGAAEAVRDDAGRLVLDVTLPAGGRHDLVLEIADRELDGPPAAQTPGIATLWDTTRSWWREAVPRFDETIGPRDARHAYAVLRGLTRPGGGMVAAATLGLPERAEQGRNYDYRYVWLRDQAYAGLAVAVDEPHDLLDEAVAYSVARVLEHGPRLAPAYTVTGRALPREQVLGLVGYPGGADVVGNHVNAQFQLDTVGELLQLLARAAHFDRLDDDGHRALRVLTDVVGERWDEPEAGIWELDDDRWTQSRLTVVAGLRATATITDGQRAGELSTLADAILARTSATSLRPDGAWARRPGDPRTDASLLLPPVRGTLPADDPRTVATLAAVGRELVQDGFVYRFQADERPLGEAEGAFLLCGFTTALACWHQGAQSDALRWYERTAAAGGPPGLFAEEWDVGERQLRGNLPQAFVHAMLLESGQRLARPVDAAARPEGHG